MSGDTLESKPGSCCPQGATAWRMDESIPQFWKKSICCDPVKYDSHSGSFGSSWNFTLEKNKWQITVKVCIWRKVISPFPPPHPSPPPHTMLFPFPGQPAVLMSCIDPFATSLKNDFMEVTSVSSSAKWLQQGWQGKDKWIGCDILVLSPSCPWQVPLKLSPLILHSAPPRLSS